MPGPGRRTLVAVIGDGAVADDHPSYLQAVALGRALVDAGHRVLCGGLGGVMEAACRGARSSARYAPGDTVGILPGHHGAAANRFVDIALPSGLGHGRNLLVVHADAVVAVGGGAGTLSEMALAWVHRRLVVALRVPGWSGRLADGPIDARPRFAHLPDDRVFGVDTAEEAVAVLGERLPAYLAAAGDP
jgi:uncharacterized protein (TIGR00725 family)